VDYAKNRLAGSELLCLVKEDERTQEAGPSLLGSEVSRAPIGLRNTRQYAQPVPAASGSRRPRLGFVGALFRRIAFASTDIANFTQTPAHTAPTRSRGW
jgi:hypothetical protein